MLQFGSSLVVLSLELSNEWVPVVVVGEVPDVVVTVVPVVVSAVVPVVSGCVETGFVEADVVD